MAVLKGELTTTMLLYTCFNSHCHMLSVYVCIYLFVTKKEEKIVVHLSRHVCVCVLPVSYCMPKMYPIGC